MFRLSAGDFFKSAYIGRYAIVETDTLGTKSGFVRKITSDEITIEDTSGLFHRINATAIRFVQIGRDTNLSKVDRDVLRKFLHKRDRNANSPDLTFARRFQSSLELFRETCVDSVLRTYVYNELARQSAPEPVIAYEDYLDRVNALPVNSSRSLLQVMLLFRLRRYSDAMQLLHIILGEAIEGSDEATLKWVCYYGQMKNDVSAFFWLSQYLRQCDDVGICEDPAWWYYLKLSVRFNAYEFLPELLYKIKRWNPRIAVESIVYLLLLNNNSIQAMQILDFLDEGISAPDVEHIVEIYSSFFSSDKENFYHRYTRCWWDILRNDRQRTYSDNETISGYIYDFIPDRKYGFILGYDLLSYFFRVESVESDGVLDEVRRNICSFQSVTEEELVQVEFTRTNQSKRTYSAIHIV